MVLRDFVVDFGMRWCYFDSSGAKLDVYEIVSYDRNCGITERVYN